MQPDRVKFPFSECDESCIQFLLLERCGSGFRLTEFPPLSWVMEGRTYLWKFMHASPSDLFWSVPDVGVGGSPLDITGFLGAGASAVVYSGQFGAISCVVKRFRAHKLSKHFSRDLVPCVFSVIFLFILFRFWPRLLVIEQNALETLAGVKGCTQFIAVSDDGGSLILSPIGNPFCLPDEKETDRESSHSQWTQSHILQFVDVIKTIHDHGLIHRDLKSGNIFPLENDGVLVNDVVSDIPCNTAALFGGTLHYATS